MSQKLYAFSKYELLFLERGALAKSAHCHSLLCGVAVFIYGVLM